MLFAVYLFLDSSTLKTYLFISLPVSLWRVIQSFFKLRASGNVCWCLEFWDFFVFLLLSFQWFYSVQILLHLKLKFKWKNAFSHRFGLGDYFLFWCVHIWVISSKLSSMALAVYNSPYFCWDQLYHNYILTNHLIMCIWTVKNNYPAEKFFSSNHTYSICIVSAGAKRKMFWYPDEMSVNAYAIAQ